MPKEIQLFLKDELTFEEKFYKLMDLLISNQVNFKFEAIIFMSIYYLQILSLFYSEQVQVFDPKKSKSDLCLYYIEKIFRVKNLLRNNYTGLKNMIYCLLILIIIFIIYFSY